MSFVNNAMISEKAKIDTEVLAVTTAAASTSLNYDMQGYNQALANVCIETTVGISTVTIDLMQSSAATVAGTSAAGSKAGMVLGGASTLISTAGGVREMTLTITTASTATDTIRLTGNGVAKTFTNINTTAGLNATAWTSTALNFGSTVGSTADTGLKTRMESLKTAVESTLGFGTAVVCSTGSTATITIKAADGMAGSLGFATTVATVTALCNQMVGAFNIKDDELASTANKRYIGLKVSSASEITRAAVTVVRTGGDYMPPTFSGKLST